MMKSSKTMLLSLLMGLVLPVVLLLGSLGEAQRCARRCPRSAARDARGCCVPSTPTAPAPARPATCAEGRIRIPGGTFEMGTTDPRVSSRAPVHTVTLSPYCIDRTEVTVEAYERCVARGVCADLTYITDIPDNPRFPITSVTWEEARTYCAAAAGRLPTEAEWEYAARGSDGRVYPWGNAPPSNQLCWNHPEGSRGCEVGAFPSGASPFGVLDMAGNADEWVADWFDTYPSGPTRDPRGPASGFTRVMRGGGTQGDPIMMLSTGRYHDPPEARVVGYGFRCASDVAP